MQPKHKTMLVICVLAFLLLIGGLGLGYRYYTNRLRERDLNAVNAVR